MIKRPLSPKDLAYEAINLSWDSVVSGYDTGRRVEVLIDDWLSDSLIIASRILEVGCGMGYFSERLFQRGARQLTATDLAPSLVEKLAQRIPSIQCRVADAMNLEAALGNESFDLVLSSEVIEHTPDPRRVVQELCRRVAPGGTLVISCPNRRWISLLYVTRALGLRKHYRGYENWVRPGDLIAWVQQEGLQVTKSEGIHTVPWQFLSYRWLRALDKKSRSWNYGCALNLALKAQRIK